MEFSSLKRQFPFAFPSKALQLLLSAENVSFSMFGHMEHSQVSWAFAAVCPQQRAIQFCYFRYWGSEGGKGIWVKGERERGVACCGCNIKAMRLTPIPPIFHPVCRLL